MQAFRIQTGPAVPLFIANIDTDQIAPTRDRATPGETPGSVSEREADPRQLFAPWRYDETGAERPDFVLNREPFRRAPILIGGANFGCGSSRESAVWMLSAHGIRCIIAPSFGGIFHDSCFKSGILPVQFDYQVVETLAREAEQPSAIFSVDLVASTVTSPSGRVIRFSIPSFRRDGLLEALDDITVTLRRNDELRAFQRMDKARRPWIYDYDDQEPGTAG